jgi:hypothetical protein
MQADKSIGVDVPRVIATNQIVPTRRVLMLEYVFPLAALALSLSTAFNYASIRLGLQLCVDTNTGTYALC